jgi:hypothetical protein
MKNFKKAVVISAIVSTFLSAGDISQKITNFYNVITNGALEFNATKAKDGYDLQIRSKNRIYKELLNPNNKIHIAVDEGPTITEPKFTFGKAGLKATIDIASIFNSKIEQDIKKTLKKSPKLNYSAIVSFGNNLNEDITIEPFSFDTKDATVSSSAGRITSDVDLDSYTGKMALEYKNLTIKPKKESGIFKIEGLSIKSQITEPPVDNIVLFSNSKFKIDNISFSAQKPKKVDLKFSCDFSGFIKKVDDKLLDFGLVFDIDTNDVNTIALSKGVKESKTSIVFKNLGTQGFLDFMKLTKQMQEAQDELALSSKGKNSNEAFAKYMATMDSLNSKLVPIYNNIFIKDKSRIILNQELTNDKTSYIKANLLYKASPIKGGLNSAFISLAAQGLAIVDGDIEIKLDKTLANSVNPMAIMVLDMLKAKGFATQKNGIYEFKATLKSGNIIVNGKSYTLQEFSRALF